MKEIGQLNGYFWSQIDISRKCFLAFLKKGLTLANLKALGNLSKDIERLQISVTSLARKLTLSFRNLPRSLSIQVAFVVSVYLNILSI